MTLAMFALADLAVQCARVHASPPMPSDGLRTVQRNPAVPNPREVTPAAQKRPYQQPVDLSVDLLPLTVPEIRHVHWTLQQAVSADAADQVLAWSGWWRRYQARA
jgi:hypothetical protein